ncbi:MAG: hypothetical protein HIU91_09245 [Acidobacteria bacterium]|nr:hypothetical protein [Acidobacteriota bacterium]
MTVSTKARTAARVTSGIRTRKAALYVTESLVIGLMVAMAGCSSDGTTTGATTGAPNVGIYVIQNTPATGTTLASGSILELSTAATSSSSPVSTIASPSSTALEFLGIDALGDIYTSSQSSKSSAINEYGAGSTGNAPTKRSIPFNSTTGLTSASALSVSSGGDVYVSNGAGGIATFSATSTGSGAPQSNVSITSDAGPQAMAIDASGNLYVATGSPVNNIAIAPVVVFAPGAAVPSRSIGGALTTMEVGSPKGLAIDSAGNLYVSNVVAGVSSILVFGAGATGNTPPLRQISGASTQLGCAGGVALDTEGFLYVVSTASCGSTADPALLKFSTTGDGNIAPVASVTSPAWTNADAPLSVAVF